MTSAEEARFAVLIRALAETFDRQLTQGQLLGYKMALDRLPLAEIERAVARAISTLKAMPPPAVLLELAGVVPAQTRAIQAWGALLSAMRVHGAWQSVDLAGDDGVANATVRSLGGWQRLCGLESDELHRFVRRDFEARYCAMAASGAVGPDERKHLAGTFELSGERVAGGVKVQRIAIGQQAKQLEAAE